MTSGTPEAVNRPIEPVWGTLRVKGISMRLVNF